MPAPSLRLGVDLDGVVADFASAFHAVEARLFGLEPAVPAGQPEREPEGEAGGDDGAGAGAPVEGVRFSRAGHDEARRRREMVWQAIRSTPDFWTTLDPLEDGAVARLHALAVHCRWDVFFITRRPATDGETVQRQTQRWLVEHGYDLPSVLVIEGSRGAAAAALRLDYHLDDDLQNCLDVQADSGARVIYITPDAASPPARLRELGIAAAPALTRALDILEQATAARENPALLQRLAALLGWR